jgi:hypothetical protein
VRVFVLPVQPMTKLEINEWIAQQDWSLTNAAIARATGVNQMTVRRRRLNAGIANGKNGRDSKWHGVDWSQSDSVIAMARGVTRQCVNAYRKRMAPKQDAQAQPDAAPVG